MKQSYLQMKVARLLGFLLLILILQASWCLANQSTNNEGVHQLAQLQGQDLQDSVKLSSGESIAAEAEKIIEERMMTSLRKSSHGGQGGRASTGGGGSQATRPHTRNGNAQPAAQSWIPILMVIIVNAIIVSVFIY